MFPCRAITSRKGAITRLMKVMKKWGPNDISKVKKGLIYILLSQSPVGLAHKLRRKVLSAAGSIKVH